MLPPGPTLDPAEREKVRQAKTPASAKSLGKRVTLREGWDMLRFEVTGRLVRAKLSDSELAAKRLAATDGAAVPDWGTVKQKARDAIAAIKAVWLS